MKHLKAMELCFMNIYRILNMMLLQLGMDCNYCKKFSLINKASISYSRLELIMISELRKHEARWEDDSRRPGNERS